MTEEEAKAKGFEDGFGVAWGMLYGWMQQRVDQLEVQLEKLKNAKQRRMKSANQRRDLHAQQMEKEARIAELKQLANKIHRELKSGAMPVPTKESENT